MPYAHNKIIINDNGVRGRVAAIKAEFITAHVLSQEILDNGWIKETAPLRDEMRAECAKVDAALDEYLAFLRRFNAKMADFIDNHP